MPARSAYVRRKTAPTSRIDKKVDDILAADDGKNGLMTVEQASAWLGVSVGWFHIRRWDEDGPPWVKDGGSVRYPKDGMRRWLKERKAGG